MNPESGELRRLRLGEQVPDGFQDLPLDLEKIAHLKLAHAAHDGPAQVNLRSTSPLARWARDRRKEKRRAKIAAASRRVNRGKR